MTKDYEMYTDFGNDAIDAIVRSARILKTDWPTVQNDLFELARKFPKDFGEATDTAVREAVYVELGFTTPFYG
jgi:hypothetical protein